MFTILRSIFFVNFKTYQYASFRETIDCTEYISDVHKCEINLFKRGKEKDVTLMHFLLQNSHHSIIYNFNRIVNFLSFIINKIALRDLWFIKVNW